MRIRTIIAALTVTFVVLLIASPAAAGEPETEPEPATEEPAAEHHDLSEDTEECIHLAEEADDPAACQEAPSLIFPATNEIIWGAASFAILFVLLAKFAWPGIKSGMEGRTERIRADLAAGEAARIEGETALADYKSQLGDAKAEAARIIEEARQTADQMKRDQESKLQAELAEMRARAAADIESSKAQAMSDLQSDVAKLAIGAAEVVVEKALDEATQIQLIESYINEVGQRS